jgi:hypothetical protein
LLRKFKIQILQNKRELDMEHNPCSNFIPLFDNKEDHYKFKNKAQEETEDCVRFRSLNSSFTEGANNCH